MKDHSGRSWLGRNAAGFTLLEMMVVVAIVAILAAVAVPSYKRYVDRSVIKTAQSDIIALSLNYENYYQRTLAYPTSDYTDTSALTTAFSGWSPASATTDFAFYTENAAATAYELKAKGRRGDLAGCVLTLKNNGERTLTGCSFASGDWL